MADQRQQVVVDEVRTAQSPDEMAEALRQKAESDFITAALARWRVAEEAESHTRVESLDDLEFRTGKQWPADIQSQRAADKRPCLTMNRLPQFCRNVTNEYRQNRPAVIVSPVGDASNVETAELLQGAVRFIERNSDSDIAIDTAFDSMVTGGFGYFRLITEYEHDFTFDQVIKIKRIKNPFLVYYDPSCVEADYSDADWAFVIEDMTAESYKAKYPRSKAASLSVTVSTGTTPAAWLSKDNVRVAEYFYIEREIKRLLRLADGFVIWEDDYKVIADGPTKPPVEAFRDARIRKVQWAKINALEILERNTWPGVWIPVIPMLGDDYDVNGKRHLAGLIRAAKDPQRMYNFWVSAATETIALAPRSPYMVVEGQIEGYEGMWQQANVRNFAFLTYKPISVAGQPAPPPQRIAYEPPIQAMALMTRQADNDLKATMGIYDASLGERGPEQSGKAILARQSQGALATLNFADNGNRAVRFMGKQLVDLIPKIYDAPRILKINHPDGRTEEVGVFNSKVTGLKQEEALKKLNNPGLAKIYDLGVGLYDVTISTGPSYQTKRQEAAEAMTELVRAYPNLMMTVGDLLVRQMDWPYANEIADRLKRTLPPEILGDTPGDPKMQVMKLQVQLKGLMEQHTILVEELNRMSEDVRTKRMELESKERIAAMQTQADLLKEEVKIRGEAALSLLQAKILDIQTRLGILNEDKPVGEGEEKKEAGGAPPEPGAPAAPVENVQ